MKKVKNILIFFALLLVLAATGLGIYAYRGSYLGEEYSPNKEYTLRYDSSINPFKMYWSMPGDSACRPMWVRLYDQSGAKLNELYTTSCELGMRASWYDQQVTLRDGNTMWDLPSK